MNYPLISNRILALCEADSLEFVESIQSLWSGYGEVIRFRLKPDNKTVVVKSVCPPEHRDHKYGWSGNVSHRRKLSSYENELLWYRGAASSCNDACRIAKLLASECENGEWLFVFEDLDAAGFPIRRSRVNESQLNSCLRWLANFHAMFIRESESPSEPYGLWKVGTYWHLATRPDELAAMPEGPLKNAAAAIDARLNEARFQTLVHGDAKLANFCFARSDSVAAVDFQYVGGGCGMKDFAYFISSCVSDAECEAREPELLASYFGFLREAICDDSLLSEIEAEWRELYPFAWADFHRFLAGWSPGHWKIHGYTTRMTERVLREL